MSEDKTHGYFSRSFTEWKIMDFLKECEVEPFKKKIDIYIKSTSILSHLETLLTLICEKQSEK